MLEILFVIQQNPLSGLKRKIRLYHAQIQQFTNKSAETMLKHYAFT